MNQPTKQQMLIAGQFSPHLVDGDKFLGDDNDMSVVITKASQHYNKIGDHHMAYLIDSTMQPEGFFHCESFEKYCEIMSQ